MRLKVNRCLVVGISLLICDLLTPSIYAQTKNSDSSTPRDDRLVKSSSSPQILDAVGRLIVKDPKTDKVNLCSASLVAFTPKQASRVLVTSAHCIRGYKHQLTWQTTKNGDNYTANVQVVEHNLGDDWAFLVLDKKLPASFIPPLIIDYENQHHLEEMIGSSGLGANFYVAGYSADKELGKNGKILTYDMTGDLSSSTRSGGIFNDIITYSGASGGAVITYFKDELAEVNTGYNYYLAGIIKGGKNEDLISKNGVKGSNDTNYVHYILFKKELFEVISKFNGPIEGIFYWE